MTHPPASLVPVAWPDPRSRMPARSTVVPRRASLALVVVALVAALAPAARAADLPSGRLGAARDASMPHASRDVLVKLRPGADPGEVLGPSADHVFGRWY